MPEYSDIYVITNKRDKATIESFLDHFLPERDESADEYEIPQYSENPEIVYSKADDLIEYCTKNINVEHSIYWRALGNAKPEHGMIFYLQDGYTIYGLSTDASNQNHAKKLLSELKQFLPSKLGYIGHEVSPDVTNLEEFKNQIEVHKP